MTGCARAGIGKWSGAALPPYRLAISGRRITGCAGALDRMGSHSGAFLQECYSRPNS